MKAVGRASQALSAAVVVVGSVAATSSVAGAHETDEVHSDGSWAYDMDTQVGLTGYCETTSSTSVRQIQALLWAYGAYGSDTINLKNEVDGVWGNNSDLAARLFQAFEGLPVDGCVGSSSHYAFSNYISNQGPLPGAVGPAAELLHYRRNSELPFVTLVNDPFSSIDFNQANCRWFYWSGYNTVSKSQTSSIPCHWDSPIGSSSHSSPVL